MTNNDILYISCDRCGAKTSQDEIYLDNYENTICINCHNHRVWKKGWWDGFTLATVIWIVVSMIAVMLMKIF